MKRLAFAAAFLSSVLMAVPACAAQDQGSLEEVQSVFDVSTDYPGVYAKPGENTTFGLDFLNTTQDSVDAALSISEIPEEWEGYFKGKNGEVSKVHVGSSYDTKEDLATFSLMIPEDAAEGEYTIVLKADAKNGISDEVELDVTVTQQENGSSTYTAEYPEQQAASGTSFSFDTTLVNNRGTAQSYSLSASAPQGWQVSFTPSGESASVASVNLEAGATQAITVAITPPETLVEGEYTIPISAVSSNDSLSEDLKITITGQYAVTLSTPSGRLSFDAYANDEKAITLTVTNTGNVDLENLNLTSSAPTDWNVTFDESTIDILEAGAAKEITAHVTPASDSMTGDYLTDITVSNAEVKSLAEFRVSVKTRTEWGFAALGVIVVLLAGLGCIFRKYGRR